MPGNSVGPNGVPREPYTEMLIINVYPVDQENPLWGKLSEILQLQVFTV